MDYLLKAYLNDDNRFSGQTTDKVDPKHMLFLERCGKAEIPEAYRFSALQIMLVEHAIYSHDAELGLSRSCERCQGLISNA